jgi:hypothetical protein
MNAGFGKKWSKGDLLLALLIFEVVLVSPYLFGKGKCCFPSAITIAFQFVQDWLDSKGLVTFKTRPVRSRKISCSKIESNWCGRLVVEAVKYPGKQPWIALFGRGTYLCSTRCRTDNNGDLAPTVAQVFLVPRVTTTRLSLVAASAGT